MKIITAVTRRNWVLGLNVRITRIKTLPVPGSDEWVIVA